MAHPAAGRDLELGDVLVVVLLRVRVGEADAPGDVVEERLLLQPVLDDVARVGREILRSARKASNSFFLPAKFSLVMRARSASISASVTSQGVPQSRASKSMILALHQVLHGLLAHLVEPLLALGRQCLAGGLGLGAALGDGAVELHLGDVGVTHARDDAVGEVLGVPATARGDQQEAHGPGDDEGGGDPRSAR